MEYKKSIELKGKTLEKGDIIYFGDLKYEVRPRYLNCVAEEDNRAVFRKLKIIEPHIFCSRIYGYPTSSGKFPDCAYEDYSALTRVAIALLELIEGKKLTTYKPKNPTHLVVWEEDRDPCRFFFSEKEASDFIKELSGKSSVKENSIVLVEIKSAKRIKISKSLRKIDYKI